MRFREFSEQTLFLKGRQRARKSTNHADSSVWSFPPFSIFKNRISRTELLNVAKPKNL